ncbi:MAG: hypothetical protein AAF211_24185 [Myxococcota bacterium]
MILAWLGGLAVASPLERHHYRVAVAAITEVLEVDDRPEWHARLGSAKARLGHYTDALPAFGHGEGAPWYEREGWRDHANTLRALGRCAEAARLRETFEPVVDDSAALWADIAEDWRACGERDAAFEAIAAAQVRTVDHPIAHAVLADLHRDQKHWTTAAYHLEKALLVEVPGDIRPRLSLAEHQMLTGDLDGAERELRRLVVGHMRDPRLFLARTALYLRTGRVGEAAALARRGPWKDHEDTRVVCRRLAIHEATDELQDADALRRLALARTGSVPRCPS